jgi:hypothetical protein
MNAPTAHEAVPCAVIPLRHHRRPVFTAITTAMAVLFLVASSVFAYTPANAASYAEQWWNLYNPMYMQFTSDCANFVSQAVFQGGYPMNYSTNNPWWYNISHAHSDSWSIVANNRGFFLGDTHPGGVIVDTFYGIKTAIHGVQGDIVYYDWRGDPNFATDPHESIVVVTSGRATSTSDVGALIDAHSNARHKEYWTLYNWNSRWGSTYYQVLHFR